MRGAFYALAAALSGAQTTALCSFDEAYTIPTPRAALLSLRTLEILMDEVACGYRRSTGGVLLHRDAHQADGSPDPRGMSAVRKIGGMRHAVAGGHIQRKVSQQAYEFEKGIQNGEYIKVGVNKYTESVEDQPDVELHAYDESWAEKQIAGLRELRRTRDNREVSRTLKELERGTRAGKKRHALPGGLLSGLYYRGEMTGVWRQVFGEWEEPGIFEFGRRNSEGGVSG